MAQLQRLIDFASEKVGADNTKYVCLAAAALPVVVGLAKGLTYFQRRRSLLKMREQYVSRVRSEVEQLEKDCKAKITEERAMEITSLPFEELQSKLQNGELTCVEVLYAYQRIAVKENKRLNFIAQPVREAEETAKALDDLDPAARKNLPLFGIPISVKENYNLPGYASTFGCSARIPLKMTGTSGIVKGFMEAGAVPFIRTNISQTMMSLGAHNPIYGQTRNPQDLRRSPGGSSSGEGAAIGAGASIIGLGSDIGGSVRVPAAWCGICALKPTVGRFSLLNQSGAIVGQTGVRGTSGLMSRDVSSLVAATRVTASDAQFNVDMGIPRLYFNEEEYNSTKPLTIGYVYDWPPIVATESSKKTITDVAARLVSRGHKLVPWELPPCDGIPAQLLLQAYFGDQGVQMVGHLEDDDVSYIFKSLICVLKLPVGIRRKIAAIAGWLMPDSATRKFLTGVAGVEDVAEYFRLQTTIAKYRQRWIDDWKSAGIDVVIAPAVPVPAEYINEKKGCSSGCGGYVYLLNMVNFPAGVVPFGKITAEDEQNDMASYPTTDAMHRDLKEMIPGSAGLALSVQCVSLPFREEQCLRLMNLIAELEQAS